MAWRVCHYVGEGGDIAICGVCLLACLDRYVVNLYRLHKKLCSARFSRSLRAVDAHRLRFLGNYDFMECVSNENRNPHV